MPIKFECEDCHKIINAPDTAGGKRGKCPSCGKLVDIPLPPPPAEEEDPDLIPLAPIDEEEERRLARERKALYAQEKSLLDAMAPSPDDVPLDQREQVDAEDLHHFVVNYLLDMFDGNLARAQMHAEKLHSFGIKGSDAVDDFVVGKADEIVLKRIPMPIRQGFLRELKERVK
jgi:hypothetical protein